MGKPCVGKTPPYQSILQKPKEEKHPKTREGGVGNPDWEENLAVSHTSVLSGKHRKHDLSCIDVTNQEALSSHNPNGIQQRGNPTGKTSSRKELYVVHIARVG